MRTPAHLDTTPGKPAPAPFAPCKPPGPPGPPGPPTGPQMVTHIVSDATTATHGAKCLDGTPPAYLLRAGTGANASKFVIFLEGGGCECPAPRRDNGPGAIRPQPSPRLATARPSLRPSLALRPPRRTAHTQWCTVDLRHAHTTRSPPTPDSPADGFGGDGSLTDLAASAMLSRG